MSRDDITHEQMLADIRETEAEIATMEREIHGFRLLGDRWSQMRADARVTGIQERKAFIEKVQKLIQERFPTPNEVARGWMGARGQFDAGDENHEEPTSISQKAKQ